MEKSHFQWTNFWGAGQSSSDDQPAEKDASGKTSSCDRSSRTKSEGTEKGMWRQCVQDHRRTIVRMSTSESDTNYARRTASSTTREARDLAIACENQTDPLPENDTTLTWEPSAGAAAYEVLWRSTNAADWEYVQPASTTTRATLNVSKDNVTFAVRAVDAAGHRSLPVVP